MENIPPDLTNVSLPPEVREATQDTDNSDSSLNLSITPPLSDNPQDGARPESSSTISEHLDSVEHDRSLQEIEVGNVVTDFSLILHNLPSEDEHISQEAKPPSLNISASSNTITNNSNTFISLNGLDKSFGRGMDPVSDAVRSTDEVLNNDSFKSQTQSKEESLDIFANVDLDDNLMNSYNLGKSVDFNLSNDLKDDNMHSYDEVSKRVQDFEELIAIKDDTIAALTSQLDSYRDMMSNPSSNSLGTSTTDYKQYQEECQNKLTEYHNAIAHKDDLIQKLTESLQQSILSREELKQQSDHLKNEIAQLQKQIQETSDTLKSHKCVPVEKTEENDLWLIEINFDAKCAPLENSLHPSQLLLLNDVKTNLKQQLQTIIDDKKRLYEEEINDLKRKMEADTVEHKTELARLKHNVDEIKASSSELSELRQELDAKHSKEVEELRTYFEKKCSDLEKNYSEEIFSQQSRKMSGSSSCSELSSDFMFNQPGPGGDCRIPDYTKKDFSRIYTDLTQLVGLLKDHNLNQLSDNEFETLKAEFKKFDLHKLFKFDLAAIRCELQNKYHAELEILREDFDNRVDVLNVEHDNKLKEIETKYLEEIEDLSAQLRAAAGPIATVTVQEVASSGEFEIDEVIQSYERRLQEQVTLAKLDLIAALEGQIQRLASSDSVDEEWPEELLQLKRSFQEKYISEIDRLNSEHESEIARLKEEHAKHLSGALERARRRSLRDADSLSKGELELLKERDCLKKQSSALRNLVSELLKYFTQCEDEVNNTIVEELLKYGLEKSLTLVEDDLNLTESINSIKRVHIAPNVDDLINIINSSGENDFESIDLKGELGMCLEKLRAEANAILALSTNINADDQAKNTQVATNLNRRNSLESKVSSLTRQLISETQTKNNLAEQLNDTKNLVQSLESERSELETNLEQILEKQKILEGDLLKAKDKIAELVENGHREIVSEGYGENGRKDMKGIIDAKAALAELQDKVRALTENPAKIDADSVQLIEEFARVSERIVEEAMKDCDDLKQQIDAADKKYKITCQFLEDQATEREQERDDAQKEIDCLREQLRDREKDRASCERITSEVEHLEQQLRDMTKLLEETDKRCQEAESERKEAVDKIFILRDIIRDLEQQVEVKVKSEEELRNIVGDLEALIKLQDRTDIDGTTRGGDLSAEVSHVQELQQHIGDLEGEVQRLRLSTEIAGSEGAIKQIRNHLSDFEITLDKRTKDLEGLHSAISTTACSSPSEDMSIRDVVNTASLPNSVFEECEVPLQQLARLKEKLVRHSRAEDAALKRIRDLEMQHLNLKADLEECQNERDIVRKQISDQLVLISSLQIRLDEQRIRAEHIEKQTNTSLECRIYDLQSTIVSLEEKLAKREKSISHLTTVIGETKQRLENRELELAANKADEIVSKMQEQIEFLRAENDKLKTKIQSEVRILPNLMENIISDKNSDIETLREKLSEAEKQLQMYSGLSLDKSDIETLNRLKLSGMSFTDLLTVDGPEIMRKMENIDESLSSSQKLPYTRAVNDTPLLGIDEISTIEKVGPANLFHSLQLQTGGKVNSTEKHVRFEDEVMDDLLKEELNKKNEIIKEYEDRLKKLLSLEGKVEQLQQTLEETERALQTKLQEQENAIMAKSSEVDQKDQLLRAVQDELHEVKAVVKDMDEEKTKLKVTNESLKTQNSQIGEMQRKIDSMEAELHKNQNEMEKYKTELKHHKDMLDDRDCEIDVINEEVQEYRNKITELEKKGNDLKSHVIKCVSDLKTKDCEIEDLKTKTGHVQKEVNHLQHLLSEKDKIINQMTEDSKSLHANLETIKSKLQETGNVVDLGRRLRDEQKKNWELLEEIHTLKAQLLNVDKKSLEEITGEVQRELEYSAYLDSSIINVLSDHSSIESQDVEALQEALKKQKRTNKDLTKAKNDTKKKLDDLETKYADLKNYVGKLEAELEEERSKLDLIQLEDGKLIEQMRIKLNNALDNETEFGKLLEREKENRAVLEKQLEAMRDKIGALTSSSKSESTEYKSLPNAEAKRLKQELEVMREQNNGINSELRALIKAKSEVESELKYVQDLAELKTREIQNLENRVKTMIQNEQLIRNQLCELNDKLEEKAREVENSRLLIEEMDQDRASMKRQMDHLNQQLKQAQHIRTKEQPVDNSAQNDGKQISEKLMEKIKELNIAVKDNIQMVDFIARLSSEKAILEQRIITLEQQHLANLPFDDPASRANYLFAKYLRSESYRKALIWQKRYLTSLLYTYQIAYPVDTRVPEFVTAAARTSRSAGKDRFKRVGLALVALNRMKFLVRRWHSGKRIIQNRAINPMARFQVGQPVSSQNFVIVPTQPAQLPTQSALSNNMPQQRAANHLTMPWFGNSPPSKDSHKSKIRSSPYPLTAPGLLSKYVERFNDIQDRLGMAMGPTQ